MSKGECQRLRGIIHRLHSYSIFPTPRKDWPSHGQFQGTGRAKPSLIPSTDRTVGTSVAVEEKGATVFAYPGLVSAELEHSLVKVAFGAVG